MTPDDLHHATASTLDGWFSHGVAPELGELHGFYAGEFLAWASASAYLLGRLPRLLLFDLPYWQGKYFWGDSTGGNVFPPDDRPGYIPKSALRYLFAVSQAAAYRDGQPCLRLDYNIERSLMRWVRDDVRCVGKGLYLGRMYLVCPWGRPFEVGFFSLQKGRDPC